MTNNEKEYMESLYAGLAMMGYLIRGAPIHKIPEDAKAMAKAMMEKETVVGLPAIKRRAKK
jgi:hypothetical protein|tara:strand:- start:131 stop:313 length:183 start_codon:yes stop_codon:yes gene_type:complete